MEVLSHHLIVEVARTVLFQTIASLTKTCGLIYIRHRRDGGPRVRSLLLGVTGEQIVGLVGEVHEGILFHRHKLAIEVVTKQLLSILLFLLSL